PAQRPPTYHPHHYRPGPKELPEHPQANPLLPSKTKSQPLLFRTPLPLQPQRKKKPHQIFRQAPTSLVNNHSSPPQPLTSSTFKNKSSLFICFPSTFIN